jgi:beta-N-acetylhexosaminidase
MDEMIAVANAVPEMTADGIARLDRAMAGTMTGDDGPEFAEAVATRDALLAFA